VSLNTIAIMLLVAVMAANAQCFAACSLFSCVSLSGPRQPAHSSSPGDCHHKAPAPDERHENSSCGHQAFVSEAIPQVQEPIVGDGVLLAIPCEAYEAIQFVALHPESARDHSPPPVSSPSLATTLRI